MAALFTTGRPESQVGHDIETYVDAQVANGPRHLRSGYNEPNYLT